MKRQTSKIRIMVALCLALALAAPEAYAWGGPRGGGGKSGGPHHYYRDGRWYQHGWFWFDTAVAILAVGALVDNLPPRHTTVVYNGAPYYYADGYYYRPYTSGGYVVVDPPRLAQPVVAAPQAVYAAQPAQVTPASDIVTINIPNARGGYTPVTLRRAGNGYVGPQGEYYSDNPTVDQLKALYGGR